MSDKIQNTIYLLKDKVKTLRKSKKTEETIDFNFLDKHLKSNKFKEQKVIPNLNSEYEIKVYFRETLNLIKWKDFMSKVVENGEKILKNKNSTSESYVILFYNSKSKKILCINWRLCTCSDSRHCYK